MTTADVATIVQQGVLNTAAGERDFSRDDSSLHGPACGVPWGQEVVEVVEGGASQTGGGSLPMAETVKRPHRSPGTASGSRRRQRSGALAEARATTANGGKVRRRHVSNDSSCCSPSPCSGVMPCILQPMKGVVARSDVPEDNSSAFAC